MWLGWGIDVAALVLVALVVVVLLSGHFPFTAVENGILGAFNYLRNDLVNGSSQLNPVSTSTLPQSVATTTIPNAAANATQSTTTVEQTVVGGNSSLLDYALGLINRDRAAYGLAPVVLAQEGSGMQHADNMLQYGYFSHWDPTGLKPYMRYTLLGGLGAVDENIAIDESSSCLGSVCTGNIDPKAAIALMENNMMYNDSICCNNGHRENILDPEHGSVSIGIAYDSSTVYLVEDFVDSYINWTVAPHYSNGTVALEGTLQPSYNISDILIGYDPAISGMSVAQLNGTSDYSYGYQIAGVIGNPYQYYQGVETIRASTYDVTDGGRADVSFNMGSLVNTYGAGEYTVMIWLSNSTPNDSFVGSTYTVFINSEGQQYTPGSV